MEAGGYRGYTEDEKYLKCTVHHTQELHKVREFQFMVDVCTDTRLNAVYVQRSKYYTQTKSGSYSLHSKDTAHTRYQTK